jgi:polygalacturonase
MDDTAAYVQVFGASATLAGAAVTAVVDVSADVVIGDVITQSPAATLRTVDAPAAAHGQAFVSGGVAYTVRQVRRLPPDGAMQQLVLARA